MSVVTPCVSPQLARALAARLRDATAAGEQLSSFAFHEGTPAPGPELSDGQEREVAHDFLLRVLHGATDPLNWEVLSAVIAAEDSAAIDTVAERIRLPRLALTERCNALIQLGLVTRDLEHDAILATPAGEALFELVCELDAAIAGWLEKRRRA
ncbi:MAG TPA: hypothetical protein VFN87_14140 [Solirubrobacteraceae bacterium]|nr:hypothetical protein [Solirubrobacteraceae bacterium]